MSVPLTPRTAAGLGSPTESGQRPLPASDSALYTPLRHVALAALCFLVLLSRSPETWIAPQFFAEDGTVFFRQQLLYGATAVITPYAGYLSTVPRLIALAASWFPLGLAPLLYGVAGLLLQTASATLFFSPFNRPLIQSDALRATCCLLFASCLQAGEMIGNVTNSQWHLFPIGLLVFAYVVRERHLGRGQQWICGFVLALVALTVPLAVLLLPITAWHVYRHRGRSVAVLAFAVLMPVQLLFFLHAKREAAADPGTEKPIRALLPRTALVTASAWSYRAVLANAVGRRPAQAVARRAGMIGGLALFAAATVASLALFLRLDGSRRRHFAVAWYVALASIAVSVLTRHLLLYFPDYRQFAFFEGVRYFWVASFLGIYMAALAVDRLHPRPASWSGAALLLILFGGGVVLNHRVPPQHETQWAQQVSDVEKWLARRHEGGPKDPLFVPISPPGWSIVLE